jgi:hypothetical protein
MEYDTNIQAHLTTELRYKSYKASSLDAVMQFSSIYEQSLRDISIYTDEMHMYSTLYESSMIGASTLLGFSDIDRSTIQGGYKLYKALSWSISTLNRQYDEYSDEYISSVQASTVFSAQYYSSSSNIPYYDDIYRTASGNAYSLYLQLYGPGGLMILYNATKFTNSSLLNDDILAQKIYDAQIMDLVNSQDLSMYQYRETFCRTTQIEYQTAYDRNVLAAVRQAQEQAQFLSTPLTTKQATNASPDVSVTRAFLWFCWIGTSVPSPSAATSISWASTTSPAVTSSPSI